MMYVDGKETVFPVKLKLERKLFEKIYQKKNYLKKM